MLTQHVRQELRREQELTEALHELRDRFLALYTAPERSPYMKKVAIEAVRADDIGPSRTAKLLGGFMLLNDMQIRILRSVKPDIFPDEHPNISDMQPHDGLWPVYTAQVALAEEWPESLQAKTCVGWIREDEADNQVDSVDYQYLYRCEQIGRGIGPYMLFAPEELWTTDESYIYLAPASERVQYSTISEQLRSMHGALDVVEKTPQSLQPPLTSKAIEPISRL